MLPKKIPSTAVTPRGQNNVIRFFKGESLPASLVADFYERYAETYEIATGKAWTYQKYASYSKNWLFFGNEVGHIAVRPQRIGPLKIVAAAGEPENPDRDKYMLKAFLELMSLKKPVWGLVTPEIAKYLARVTKGHFMTLDGYTIHTLCSPIEVSATDDNGNRFEYEFPPVIPAMVISGSPFTVEITQNGIHVNDTELGSVGLKKFMVDKNWMKFTVEEISKLIKKLSLTFAVDEISTKFVQNYIRKLIDVIHTLEGMGGFNAGNQLQGALKALPQLAEGYKVSRKYLKERTNKLLEKRLRHSTLSNLKETTMSQIGRFINQAIELGYVTPEEFAADTSTTTQEIKEELMALGAWHHAKGFEGTLRGENALKLWSRLSGVEGGFETEMADSESQDTLAYPQSNVTGEPERFSEDFVNQFAKIFYS